MKKTAVDLERAATGQGGRFYGVYCATVTSAFHPDRPGAVAIRLPMFAAAGKGHEIWARLAVPMAGNGRGTYMMPEVDDEVLVAFEAGDPRRPYVLGAMWNGVDAPPVEASEENNIKTIVSRSGIRITLDDTDGAEKLSLETAGGQVLTLDDEDQAVVLADDSGNRIRLGPGGVTIESSAKIEVSGASLECTVGSLTVNAGITTFSGVVKCDALITNSVVSASYTPGAGNIW